MRPLLAALIPIALSALYLTLVALSQPPAGLRPKVFVIGLSKTGTSSTGDALYQLGYRRLGWHEMRSRHLVQSYMHGDYDAIMDVTRFYDAFEDLPWPALYRPLAELYPDAKFLLSLRRDDETWLRSLSTHLTHGWWGPAEFWWGTLAVDESNREAVLDVYRNHTAEVRAFFADKPDRYAELVIDDGDSSWDALCRVAQCPGGRPPPVSYPKANTVAEWKEDRFGSWIRRTRGDSFAVAEMHLAHLYYGGRHPYLSKLMEATWHVMSTTELAMTNIFFILRRQLVQSGWVAELKD